MSDNEASEHAASVESAEPVSGPEEAPGRAWISPTHPATSAETVPARLSESLDAVAESADPVAALDAVVQAVADELSTRASADEASAGAGTVDNQVEGAIETLVGVALQADDPVTALEEGADSLAEALAARDVAADEAFQRARERHVDEQAAYRHARFHRVSELIDLGYSLDQALGITNANEAEIRAKAVAAGRDPMQPIYEYAVRNGYRPAPPERVVKVRSSQGRHGTSMRGRDQSVAEALAQMSDEAFAEATEGDRWQRLMTS